MYECPRCLYQTNQKGHMKNHFNRKIACECLNEDISIEQCLNKINNGEFKIKILKAKKKHKCEYCDKVFDRKIRLNSHLNKCYQKKSILELMKKQQEQIEKLEEKLEKQEKTTTNNTVNNSNCNNTTNNFNINITAFKDTDYSVIKDEIIKCLEDKGDVPMFEQLVDKIHFNKDNPENHNIYKPNIRDDRLLTFNGEDFIVDKNALDTILTKLEEIIEKSVDKETGKRYIRKLKTHLKLKESDHEYLDQTKEDISVALYNGRNIVKNTHKSNKE